MEDLINSFFPLGVVLMLAVLLGGRQVASLRLKGPSQGRRTLKTSHTPRNVSRLVPLAGPVSVEVSKESDFPEGWWTSEKQLALEQRAIFSKQWLHITHRSRFNKPGDYVTFEVPSFSFFIILGKDHVLRAFHNVCRHRAYTITKKAAGSSLVLGCRYHGWSYDTKGALVKAPHFMDLPEFDKSQNNLFEIPLHTDEQGLVSVNFDKVVKSTVWHYQRSKRAWKDWAAPAQSTWITSWDVEGAFNWKLAARHSSSDKPPALKGDIPKSLFESLYERISDSIGRNGNKSYHSFPLQTIYPNAGTSLWLSVTIFPRSATRSSVQYDLYSNNPKGAASVSKKTLEVVERDARSSVRRLEKDFALLKTGNEKEGVVDTETQYAIFELLKTHQMLEQMLPEPKQSHASDCGQAEKMCKELESLDSFSEDLDW